MEHEIVQQAAGHAAVHEAFYLQPAFWVAAAFLVFVFLAYKPISRAIGRGLDARSKLIASELTEARRLREEAQELLASFQKKQRESLQEAEEMLAAARTDAARISEKAEAELKAGIEKRMKMASDKIAQAEARALAEVQAYVADIALAAARRIISEQVEKGGDDAMIRRAAEGIKGKIH